MNNKKQVTTLQETYTLPSGGLLNQIPEDYVIRSMTTREEKLRLGTTGRFFKIMSGIIDACVVEPENFSSYDLCLQDFIHLMYKLRTVTYGHDYKPTIRCPHCKNIIQPTIDLDELKCVGLDKKYIEPYNIGELPFKGDSIGLRILTARDVDEISRRADAIKKNFPDALGDQSYAIRLAMMISTVNGEKMDIDSLEDYVDGLMARDSNYITQKYDKIKFGLDTLCSVECSHCGKTVDFALPIDNEFFRPAID